jgi:hypothetical protein
MGDRLEDTVIDARIVFKWILEGMDWTHLAQDMVQFQTLVNMDMKVEAP